MIDAFDHGHGVQRAIERFLPAPPAPLLYAATWNPVVWVLFTDEIKGIERRFVCALASRLMMAWTAFVDESGLFEPHERGWLPGLRLVAGVLLPLAPDQAEQSARDALERALAGKELQDVLSFVHAAELTDEHRLAAVLLRSERCPAELRAQAQRVEQSPGLLAPVGIKALRALRTEAGALLSQTGGWALGVSEFGCPTTVRGEIGPLPYPRMLRAWLEHALMLLALRQQGPCPLKVVVARRGGPLPAHESIWRPRLDELADERCQVHLDVTVAAAQKSAGLQVADLFAHALGPGAQQMLPPSADFIARRREATLKALVHSRFGSHVDYIERDASTDYRLVNRATQVLGREVAFARVASEARALPPTPLPPGHFPASLEACARTVPAIRRLWT